MPAVLDLMAIPWELKKGRDPASRVLGLALRYHPIGKSVKNPLT